MRSPFLFALMGVALVACKTPKGETPKEKRDYVLQMHDKTVAELYRLRPAAKQHVETAAGYAVFNNLETKIFITASGHGYGIAVDNRSGTKTYMRMGEFGAGFGWGIKDFRAVFVFDSARVLERFIDKGWEFGAQADVAAKAGEDGGQVSGRSSAWEGVTIYQFTQNGLSLSANVMGTKYWKDKKLN